MMIENTKFEVLTERGWEKFDGIASKLSKKTVKIVFDDGSYIETTEEHLLSNGSFWIKAMDVVEGEIISDKAVTHVEFIDDEKQVYDLINVEGSDYITNDVTSHNCSFGSVSGALLSAFALKSLEAQPPIVSNDHLFKYDEPQRGHSYMLVADVSRGKGLDYSAFSVIDISVIPYKQVCVYRNNQIVPTDYATAIYRIGKMYNEAYVLVENNDAGCQVVDILNLDYGYESLMFTETQNNRKVLSSGFGKNAEGGVRTTKSVKMLGCATMKTLIEGNKLHVVDKNTIIELKNFVRIGDSYAAEAPHHDDITMGLVLFSWAVDQSYFKEISDIDIDGILREKSSDEWDEELLGFGFMTNDDEPSNFLTNTW